MSSLWQPIESAPKDGTKILACIRDYDTRHPFDLSANPITVSLRVYHPNSQGQKGWRDASGIKRPYLTHWMPMIEGPVTES